MAMRLWRYPTASINGSNRQNKKAPDEICDRLYNTLSEFSEIRVLLLSAGAPAAIDRYLLPAGHSAANPPAAVAAVDRWGRQRDRQTDGRTDAWPLAYTDPVPHSMWAASINGSGMKNARTPHEICDRLYYTFIWVQWNLCVPLFYESVHMNSGKSTYFVRWTSLFRW